MVTVTLFYFDSSCYFIFVHAALSFCFYVLDYLIDLFAILNLSIFYTPPLEFYSFNCTLLIVIFSFFIF